MTQNAAAEAGPGGPAAGGAGDVEDLLPALEGELVRLSRRARVAARRCAAALHPRLEPTAFPLVMLLAESPGLRMSQVAAELSLEKSTVTRQVDAAVRVGLVQRIPDPRDSRARLVTLTPVGEDRMNRLLAERRSRWHSELHTWDTADVAELTRLLGRLGKTDVA